jgi:hypothetical protein
MRKLLGWRRAPGPGLNEVLDLGLGFRRVFNGIGEAILDEEGAIPKNQELRFQVLRHAPKDAVEGIIGPLSGELSIALGKGHRAFRDEDSALMQVGNLALLGGVLAGEDLRAATLRSRINVNRGHNRGIRPIGPGDIRPGLIVLIHLRPDESAYVLGEMNPEMACRTVSSGIVSNGEDRDQGAATMFMRRANVAMRRMRIMWGI